MHGAILVVGPSSVKNHYGSHTLDKLLRVNAMRILRLPAVSELTGLPRSTLYLYMSKGLFPKPIKLGVKSVGWIQEEVDQWLRQKMESRAS